MLTVLRHLLLFLSCLPLVVGCCWSVGSGRTSHAEDSARIGWRLHDVDVRAERMASQGSSHDQDSDHGCLQGFTSRSGGLNADRLGGVQICHSSVVEPCSKMTHAAVCYMPESPWFPSLRSHLAKQVLLI